MNHPDHYTEHEHGPDCGRDCDGWPTTPEEVAAAARVDAAIEIEAGRLPEGWVKDPDRDAWHLINGGLVTWLSMGAVPELLDELGLKLEHPVKGWRWAVYIDGERLLDHGETLLGLDAIEAAAKVKPEKELRA